MYLPLKKYDERKKSKTFFPFLFRNTYFNSLSSKKLLKELNHICEKVNSLTCFNKIAKTNVKKSIIRSYKC